MVTTGPDEPFQKLGLLAHNLEGMPFPDPANTLPRQLLISSAQKILTTWQSIAGVSGMIMDEDDPATYETMFAGRDAYLTGLGSFAQIWAERIDEWIQAHWTEREAAEASL